MCVCVCSCNVTIRNYSIKVVFKEIKSHVKITS